MLCSYCKNEFDQKLNIPRLLILCGHSLCETCCYRLHLNNRVQCPQCKANTFIESISLLPKNLALINYQASHNQQLCTKHHKKYEAFCENENVLICIECILSDGHKNHEMSSIRNFFDKNKQKWSKKVQKIFNFLQRIQQNLSQNQKMQEEFISIYDNSKESINLFFKQIRDIIDRQQETILNKFKDTFNQANNKYLHKIEILNKHYENINITINDLERYSAESELEFLASYHNREDIFASINFNLEEISKMPTLTYSKKLIAQTINKNIQSTVSEKIEKSDKKVSVPFISSYSSIANSIKKNNEPAISTIKAIKKVTPNSTQNNFNTNNSNNKKKYGMKKEITSTIVSQTSNTSPSILTNKTNALPGKQKIEINYTTVPKEIKSDISMVDQKESLCHSFISNMTSFLSERKSIYLVGGFNDEANNIVKLNLTTMNWQTVSSLSTNRSKFGAIAIGKQLYLFGGKKGKERVNDCEVYNILDNKWCKFNSINKIRSGFAIVHIDDLLYFIGGNDGDNILNSVQTLNITTGQWKKKQSMHEARDELAVVVGNNNRIYAIGGFGGSNNSPLKSAQVYDPRTEKWRQLPSMHQPRRALSAAVLADGIYAIGGFDGNNYMRSVEKYEEGDKEWVRIGQMKQARCTHSSISLFQSQQIYVFGGFDYVPLDSVQKYNIITNEWQMVCKMPQPRFMHSSLLLKQD